MIPSVEMVRGNELLGEGRFDELMVPAKRRQVPIKVS